jgi:probable phosphoglycerate mutase
MTTLIVARHGNTFEDAETPRRVGLRTDLPLTAKGRMQAGALGRWLKDNKLVPDVVYCSQLKRTIETASLAIKETGVAQPVFQLEILNEIDYGPDENMEEPAVLARIGAEALKAWNESGHVPDGWLADPAAIIGHWHGFADSIREHDDNETVLAVTSNGIARFAPQIACNAAAFDTAQGLKLATGAFGIMRYGDGRWTIERWNVRPPLPVLH